jgi:hypothetical protein
MKKPEEPRFAIMAQVMEFLTDIEPGEQIVIRRTEGGPGKEWLVIFEPNPSEEKVSD